MLLTANLSTTSTSLSRCPSRAGLLGCRRVPVARKSSQWDRNVLCRNKLGDELLDYVTAGPKLRKWYGQGQKLPRDGGGSDDEPEQDPKESQPIVRDAVFVTDADSTTGEQLILQLILARSRIKACFQDTVKAKTSYGPYVEPVSFDLGSQRACETYLKDVKAVVCLGRLASLPAAAKAAGVEHIVLLSTAGGSGGGFSFFGGGGDAELREPKREQAIESCGVPYTIVRASSIQDAPGGRSRLRLVPGGSAMGASGAVSREDIARVLVQSLSSCPTSGISFQVVATQEATGGQPEDLASAIAALQEPSAAAR